MQTRTDASLLVAVAAAVIYGTSAIVIAYLWLGEVPFVLSVIGSGRPGEQPQKLARVIFEDLWQARDRSTASRKEHGIPPGVTAGV